MALRTPDIPPLEFERWSFEVVDDPDILKAIVGSFLFCAYPDQWENYGTLDREDAAQFVKKAILSLRRTWTMIGAVIPILSDIVPAFCLPMDGTAHLRVDYPDLYAVIPTSFKLDADTFFIPDMEGKFTKSLDVGEDVGDEGGEALVTLTVDELPSHTHTDSGHAHSTTAGGLTGALVAVPPDVLPVPAYDFLGFTGSASANIQNTGGDQAHENRPPYIALRYVIVAR